MHVFSVTGVKIETLSLTQYLILMVTIVILEIVAGILGFVYRDVLVILLGINKNLPCILLHVNKVI